MSIITLVLNPPPNYSHQGTKAQRDAIGFYFRDKKSLFFVLLSAFVSLWQRKSKKMAVDLGCIIVSEIIASRYTFRCLGLSTF